MSTLTNNRYSQESYGVNATQRSIPFGAVIGEKMGQRTTLNQPHTPIKTLPTAEKNFATTTPYINQTSQKGGYPVYPPQTIPMTSVQQPQAFYQQVEHVQKPNPPPPQHRVEYVPYQQKYIDYVEQRQWVPVQRAFTDYYQIQHIVDYVPVEKEDYVMVTEAREAVDYKIQYVPIDQKIIHLTEANARALGYDMNNKNLAFNKNRNMTHNYEGQKRYVIENPSTLNYVQTANYRNPQVNNFQPRKSRTNYVTTDGYDGNANLKKIDQALSQSSVRGSHAGSRVIM